MPTDLPENDRELVEAARRGVPWEARIPAPTPTQLADPDFVRMMPEIRATTIHKLCLGLWDDVTVDPRGVHVRGAQIAGPLNLSFGTARVPLRLLYCHVADQPDFQQASLPHLALSGSRLEAGLLGDMLRIAGSVVCDHGFTALGEIRLLGAEIGGTLNFGGAVLDGKEGKALSADRARIRGSIFCDNGFTATGGVRFVGAEIGGNFGFKGATLNGNGGDALETDRIRINGGVFCDNRFTATGTVRFVGAEIRGNFGFTGANLNGQDGSALNAEGATIKGSLYCRSGIDVRKVFSISLTFFRGSFRIQGHAIFSEARVDRVFDWRPTQWTGCLDLRHARVGQWQDGWTGQKWGCADADGQARSVRLTDFVYSGFAEHKEVVRDAKSRIAWVRAALDGAYRPGPYEVLAAALRREGDEDGAKDVLRAKRQDQRAYQRRKHQDGSPAEWAWLNPIRHSFSILLDCTVGYGYRPWLGAPWLLGVLLFGWLVFSLNAPTTAAGSGIIKPAHPITIMQDLHRRADCTGPDNTECAKRYKTGQNPHRHDVLYNLPTEYTPFNAFWYSLDTLIPLIDLGQEKAWSPSPHGTIHEDLKGWLVLGYLYFHILLGWTLSTLTVVALSGLIKRDRE